jgi:hypothetical protein
MLEATSPRSIQPMLLHQLHTESRRNFLRFHCPTDRNLKKPNSYLFTMGMYGCGKTTSINNNPDLKKLVEKAGVVSEGAYNNVKYFDGVVADMDKKGFESSLLYVYNDAETGYTNCMERLISSNRAVTCEPYISVFPQFQGRVEYIETHHPNMPFYCIDNSHNNGGRRVTNEEAKQWDYTMTEDLQQKLYAIKQAYIDSGWLTPEQIAALQ